MKRSAAVSEKPSGATRSADAALTTKARWAALVALLPLGCQLVFGDFTIDTRELYPAPSGPICGFGEYRCDAGALQICSSDRASFVTLTRCEVADHCNLRTQSCSPCQPGETRCNGRDFERCNADGSFSKTQCESAALCSAQAGCLEPLCEVGQHRCMDGRLERCAAERNGWELLSVCGAPELCDEASVQASVADGKPATCKEPVCSRGQFRCEGDQPQACSADRTSWEDQGAACSSGAPCNPATGKCETCSDGAKVCSGQDLLECRGGAFELLGSCGSLDRCRASIASGTCAEAECDAPGQVSCGGNAVQRCSEGRRWERISGCQSAGFCSAESLRCSVPACKPSARRCVGSSLFVCNGAGTSYEALETCAAGQHCDLAQGCTAAPCAPGSLRCNDRFLEVCGPGGWQVRSTCATAALCNVTGAPDCMPPVCGRELPEFRCVEEQPQQCNPERNAYQAIRSRCAADELCDATLGRCVPR